MTQDLSTYFLIDIVKQIPVPDVAMDRHMQDVGFPLVALFLTTAAENADLPGKIFADSGINRTGLAQGEAERGQRFSSSSTVFNGGNHIHDLTDIPGAPQNHDIADADPGISVRSWM